MQRLCQGKVHGWREIPLQGRLSSELVQDGGYGLNYPTIMISKLQNARKGFVIASKTHQQRKSKESVETRRPSSPLTLAALRTRIGEQRRSQDKTSQVHRRPAFRRQGLGCIRPAFILPDAKLYSMLKRKKRTTCYLDYFFSKRLGSS